MFWIGWLFGLSWLPLLQPLRNLDPSERRRHLKRYSIQEVLRALEFPQQFGLIRTDPDIAPDSLPPANHHLIARASISDKLLHAHPPSFDACDDVALQIINIERF